MLGYRNAVLDLQKTMSPLLSKQLMAEIGDGVSIVVGPMVLEDIYGPSRLLPNRPAFEETEAKRRAALLMLVAGMESAREQEALRAGMLIFLRSSGVGETEVEIGGGKTVKMRWNAKGKMHKAFEFTEDVRQRFCEWAKGQVEAKFGGT